MNEVERKCDKCQRTFSMPAENEYMFCPYCCERLNERGLPTSSQVPKVGDDVPISVRSKVQIAKDKYVRFVNEHIRCNGKSWEDLDDNDYDSFLDDFEALKGYEINQNHVEPILNLLYEAEREYTFYPEVHKLISIVLLIQQPWTDDCPGSNPYEHCPYPVMYLSTCSRDAYYLKEESVPAAYVESKRTEEKKGLFSKEVTVEYSRITFEKWKTTLNSRGSSNKSKRRKALADSINHIEKWLGLLEDRDVYQEAVDFSNLILLYASAGHLVDSVKPVISENRSTSYGSKTLVDDLVDLYIPLIRSQNTSERSQQFADVFLQMALGSKKYEAVKVFETKTW